MGRQRTVEVCPHSPSCFECPEEDCKVFTYLAPKMNALPGDLADGTQEKRPKSSTPQPPREGKA